ncbi:MAG: hypothetical protein Q8927_03535 [Bacteroidota bacterium]|nr:hypothetical protein [Bacteroidota bacterium]MDP4215248.1 hypothetical protein [Bacteroidota bacterium]MDP4247268.1 hypothetical protein [Bacteroidota bacterium]MDP4254724.1 hypothetical protein [Bacteroidota bacterium]MDP4258096.1 hypothetical protein [Bacteroidota bacterium]
MKKGKNRTMLVLALEIAAIVILHAVKLNQTEKMAANKETIHNSAANQTETRINAPYSLAAIK